jgi:hypothetical protein
MEEEEIWKDIPGYDRNYQVSNLCNFRFEKNGTLTTVNLGWMGNPKKLGKEKCYKKIYLFKNGKRIGCTAHRVLMKIFVGESDLCVNHIDGNRHNNNLSNLEYVTYRENSIHPNVKRKKTSGSIRVG